MLPDVMLKLSCIYTHHALNQIPMKNLNYNFIMNVQVFYIATYGIVVIVNPFTAIIIICPIPAITNIYMLSSSRYIYICASQYPMHLF